MASKKFGPYISYQQRLDKRKVSLTTQVDSFVADTKEKLLAVMRDAIQTTVNEMQTPTAKGGKMRVLTSFLRSSGLASLEGVPAGESKPSENKAYEWTGDALAVVLSKMKLGDTFYWGWTANYAKYREAYDGFMESALMNWQRNVDASIGKLKNRKK